MAVEDRVETRQDVVDLLLGQHMQIRDLFLEVRSATGTGRRDAFERLVRLLAVHETAAAEEEVVHPMARRVVGVGDGVVDDRLAEERERLRLLAGWSGRRRSRRRHIRTRERRPRRRTWPWVRYWRSSTAPRTPSAERRRTRNDRATVSGQGPSRSLPTHVSGSPSLRLPDGPRSGAAGRGLGDDNRTCRIRRESGSAMPRGTTHAEPVGLSGAEHQPAVMVAIEVVLLWPRGLGVEPVTVDEAGLWPVFVLVVGERRDLVNSPARPLFELLDAPELPDEITLVGGRSRWAVVDPRHALLRLSVEADVPVRFEADVLVPAERVLGILDVVARGATIGITTRRHVAGLGDRVDVRAALRHVVLLSCSPSPELSELAQGLCDVGPD